MNQSNPVIIILDRDPYGKLNDMLKQTMGANRQYVIDKFKYLFERSFSMRFQPLPLQFVQDKEVVCTYIHLNMFGFLQERHKFRGWSTKSILLELVKFNGLQLMNVGSILQNDRDIVIAACSNDGYAIKFASDRLKNDREIGRISMNFDAMTYEYIGESLKSDPELVEMALRKDGLMLGNAPKCIQQDTKFIQIAINQNPNAILFAPPHIQQDHSIIHECLVRSPLLVVLISELDQKTAIQLVNKDARVYQFLPATLKKDKDVLITMLESDINAGSLIGESVFENEEIMIEILKIFPQCFEKVPYHLKKKECIIKAFEYGNIESDFSDLDADFSCGALFLDKNKIVSGLTIRKFTGCTELAKIQPTPVSPYKENARLIMHFGNSYFREHTSINSQNNWTRFECGQFPIRFNEID